MGVVHGHPLAALLAHRKVNVLAALLKSAHPDVLIVSKEIDNVDDIAKARAGHVVGQLHRNTPDSHLA